MGSDEGRELQRKVRRVCKDVLDAKLSLGAFVASWPVEADKIDFFKEIYADLEDGVEHAPGFWRKPGVDHESWRRSDLYFRVYLDYVLLSSEKPFTELMRCRNALQDREELSTGMIEDKVREFFSG